MNGTISLYNFMVDNQNPRLELKCQLNLKYPVRMITPYSVAESSSMAFFLLCLRNSEKLKTIKVPKPLLKMIYDMNRDNRVAVCGDDKKVHFFRIKQGNELQILHSFEAGNQNVHYVENLHEGNPNLWLTG